MRNNVYILNHHSKIFHDIKFGRILKQEILLANDLRSAALATKLLEGDPATKEGTTIASRMDGAIRYQINGQDYAAPAIDIVLDGAGNDITATLFGAWRFQINALGVVTSTAADSAADMDFASIQTALQELANNALVANTLVIGYLVIEATGSGFTIGTDLPVTSDVNVTAATYYDEVGNSGVVTAAASIAVGATPEQINLGAATVKVNGLELAQIAADTSLAFPVADTITTLLFGGWLIVSDNAGTGYSLISADGKEEASLMAYVDYAAVDSALDDIQARLPGRLVPIARLIIKNGVKAPWTAITDDLTDGSDVVESRFQLIAANVGIQRVSETAIDDITGAVGD